MRIYLLIIISLSCAKADLPQTDFLLVADMHGFSVINLVNGDLGDHVFHNLSVDVSNMIAIDFDVVKKRVYFSDVTTKRILSSTIDGEDVRVEIINNETATIDGLAIDSHARLLFYTDTGNDIIRKLNMNDYDDYEDVISTNMSEPRTIVLDTTERMIYWTDWGVRTIERATYEGTEREILFTEKHLYFPNGLAIDFQVGRIYWVDAAYDYIGSANFDGTNVTAVASLGSIHTFGIALYKEMYIISDWDTKTVIPIWKNLSVGSTQTGFERPCDIHVYLWEECTLLPAPTNGSVSYSNSNQYGSTAYFNCENNYYLLGNSVSICQTDGSWNGSLPECKEKVDIGSACNKDDECLSSGAKCTGGVCSCTKLSDSTSDRCDTTAHEEEYQKPSELTGEQKLLKELFRQYNKLARPQGSPLNVSHFIELRRIVGLYSKKYVVGLDILDNQEWTDDRLVWNPIAYSNVTLLHVPSDVIWTPDIVVVNSADEYPMASQPTGNVIIHSDGSIVYYQSKLIYAYGCTRQDKTKPRFNKRYTESQDIQLKHKKYQNNVILK
ncbi:prolow-density lipoprotein receptor-related protein 1-like isoform X2 [Mya arenaria]|uniref:prolow-density lipoprotein receptor-related protein 1-like isoform X2 n=1 Tax=Mya arenaria TaxID=6604 RepID=UPI0022E88007|nr:prolow-density lipoprotein receptor-related protein 1-like isoform X2 [Mya arenaria]